MISQCYESTSFNTLLTFTIPLFHWNPPVVLPLHKMVQYMTPLTTVPSNYPRRLQSCRTPYVGTYLVAVYSYRSAWIAKFLRLHSLPLWRFQFHCYGCRCQKIAFCCSPGHDKGIVSLRNPEQAHELWCFRSPSVMFQTLPFQTQPGSFVESEFSNLVPVTNDFIQVGVLGPLLSQGRLYCSAMWYSVSVFKWY